MSVVTVNGERLGYEEAGVGTPIVFLHGVGTDRMAWRPQMAHFSLSWRAIALDYPGYGESDRPARPLSREDIAGRLLGAWSELGVKKTHLVGLSMGGVVALEILRQAPERILSLTLADSFAYHPDGRAIVERNHRAIEAMTMRQFACQCVSHLVAPSAGPEVRHQLVEVMGTIDPGVYHWATSAVWTADYRTLLPSLKARTLVLVGEHDERTPLTLSDELRRGIPGALLVVVPGCGHLTNMENPSEFNRILSEFLIGP